MSKAKILVNLFHPDISRSRANSIVAAKIRDLPNVTYRDVYGECEGFAFPPGIKGYKSISNEEIARQAESCRKFLSEYGS